LPPKKHAKNNIWKIFSLFKKKPTPPAPKLKNGLEKIMGRPLNIKQKTFCAAVYITVYLATFRIVFNLWLTFVILPVLALFILLLLAISLIFCAAEDAAETAATIQNPNATEYEKLNRVSKSAFYPLAKEFLTTLKNINAQFGPSGNTPLHEIAINNFFLYKILSPPLWQKDKFELIKWMIDEQFANVSALNNNDATTHQLLNPAVGAAGLIPGMYDILLEAIQYLQDKENAQQDLVNRVDALKNRLDNNPSQATIDNLPEEEQRFANSVKNIDNAPNAFKEIKQLIRSRTVPGYAKMLVLPKLVDLLKDHRTVCLKNNICTEDNITSFYQHIIFNEQFLTELEFRPAVEFARAQNIQDMNDETIFEASIENGTNDTSYKAISLTMETTPRLYQINKESLITLLEEEQPTGKKIIRRKAEQYIQSLHNAREKRNKKKFRDLANPLIVAYELGKIVPENRGLDQVNQNISLPQEVVGRIMSYAGGDFGNKLLI